MAKKQNKRNVRHTRKEKSDGNILMKIKNSMKWVFGMFAGVVLTLSLIFIGIWIVGIETSNWFPLSRLEVQGQKYTQAEELYNSFQKIQDRGFFSMNMQSAEKEISALPWVKKVQLRKIWPETLSLTLVEHQPLAFWGEKGVVSKEGKVFYPKSLPQEKWVTLTGPDAIASELTELLQMYQTELAKKELSVASIELSERGAVSLKLQDGANVKLGKYQVAERLGRFLEQIDTLKNYKKDPLAYVDLRYQNGLVVAWSGNKKIQAEELGGNSNR